MKYASLSIYDFFMICYAFIQFLQRPNDHYFTNLPIYGRLVHLEVERVGAETLYYILKNSKNLKTLVIKNVSLFELQVMSNYSYSLLLN